MECTIVGDVQVLHINNVMDIFSIFVGSRGGDSVQKHKSE